MSDSYESAFKSIRARVLAAADSRNFTLIAVSKTQPVEAIEALYKLGHRDFGESYVQELVEKAIELQARGCPDIRWHFIGHLQTNKVKALIPHVHTVHTVDSERLAQELAKRWKSSGKPTAERLPIFIEVNIDNEPAKSGVSADEARELAETVANLPELSLQGLMAIPASTGDAEATRGAFRRLRELEKACRPLTAGKLSMGMSGDFELALHEGATHVRVGTAIFGKRWSPPFG